MPVLRVLLAVLLLAYTEPAHAVEYWDAQQCAESILDTVEHLEENVERIKEALVLLDEAQRKGDAAAAAQLQRVIESNRFAGIQSKLRRLDEIDFIYCDESLIDPSLIARADATRPWAEETQTGVPEVEEAVDLQITDVSSTFVPYEMLDTGGCRGPFIDLAVTISNRGGTFPRPVDLQKRSREYADAAATMLYFAVNLEFDWSNGVTGGQQAIIVDKSMLGGGELPKGSSITLPLRMPVGNNQTAVTVKPKILAGPFLQISGDNRETERVPFIFDIPIWDAYTQSVIIVSGPSLEDKKVITGGIKATIVNLGQSPFPGGIEGNFGVRQQDGTRLMTLSGKSLEGTTDIYAGTELPAPIKGKTLVDSSLVLLCPDGSYGSLSDGNIENNTRTLQGGS